jgi:Tfp pilus assembly protein PilN
MRAVNLLPREVTKTKGRQVSAPLLTGMIAALVVVAVLGTGFVRESKNVSSKRNELDAARAELALVPAPVAPDAMSSTLTTERAQRITALQGALNGRISWDRVLREISLVLPNDVWLTGLTLEAPAAAAAPVPTDSTTETTTAPATPAPVTTGFTMNGKAFTHVGVARLLKRLALIPDLENVTLGHSTRTAVGTREAVEFSVTAGVRVPGATP